MTALKENLHLPLPAGSRPAMGARSLLEQLHYQYEMTPGKWALPPSLGTGAALTLRAMAHAILHGDSLDPNALLQAWKDLPLIFPPEFIEKWEGQKPWKDWGLSSHLTNAYQDRLDSEYPSEAYLAVDKNGEYTMRQIWTAFLTNTHRADLFALFNCSADFWDDWVKRHPHHTNASRSQEELIYAMMCLGVPEDHASCLTLLETWWMSMEKYFPSCVELFMNIARTSECWAGMCAAALGVDQEHLAGFFQPQSPAVKLKLYSGLNITKETDPSSMHREQGMATLRNLRHPQWLLAIREWATYGILPWLLPKPAIGPRENNAARWSHLDGQFEEIVNALQSPTPMRLLVVGEHGMGKTQLVKDILDSSFKTALPVPLAKEKASFRNGQEPTQTDLLTRTGWQAALNPSAVMIVDNANKAFEADDMAQWMENAPRNAPLVVICSELKTFQSIARERFDKILWVDHMNLEARVRLANEHFPTPELALRAARTLRTPKAIVDAARWCQQTNSWSWETISAHHKASKRAAENTGWMPAKQELEILAPTPVEDLPPLAGNAHLEELAHRLSIAFQNPEKFAAMGTAPPKGAVLIGPPGTGKTLFARHLAARLQTPVLKPDPAKLFENANEVAKLFEAARANVPCLILLDEAEKVICPRPGLAPPSALGSLLTEIDGVSSMEGIMVIATTNTPYVASALTRPGRLSEVRHVSAPFSEDRQAIWQAYLEKRPLEENNLPLEKWIQTLSKASRGFSGAEIADTLRQSAGDAVARGQTQLSLSDLLKACDNVRWAAADGHDSILPHERKAVAIHEAGHALMAWRWGFDVLRITVRSRTDSLGMVQWNTQERTHCASRKQLFGKTQMFLGGIAAEQAYFQEYESGGSSDLQQTRRLVNLSFAYGGLGSMGPMAAPADAANWSEQLRQRLDMEIQSWSNQAFEEAQQWLSQNKGLLERLADRLLELGDLSGPEMDEFEEAAQSVANLPIIPKPLQFPASTSGISSPSLTDRADLQTTSHTLHRE